MADKVVFADLTLADLTVGYYDYTTTSAWAAQGKALVASRGPRTVKRVS